MEINLKFALWMKKKSNQVTQIWGRHQYATFGSEYFKRQKNDNDTHTFTNL